MPRRTPGPPCVVCKQPSVAKGLCDKHYRRQKQFGDVEGTLRPADWGKKCVHVHADRWAWTKRTREGRVARWDSLWAFAEDIGEQPPHTRLDRLDRTKPWGPDNFYWNARLLREGKSRDDKAAYQREWRKRNPYRAKEACLKKQYGITLADYDAMLERQGGGCAICGTSQDGDYFSLAVDHCHATGKIRGVLCAHCNRGLGAYRDDPERLRAAAEYLERAA